VLLDSPKIEHAAEETVPWELVDVDSAKMPAKKTERGHAHEIQEVAGEEGQEANQTEQEYQGCCRTNLLLGSLGLRNTYTSRSDLAPEPVRLESCTVQRL
jgi:hypothetical protein